MKSGGLVWMVFAGIVLSMLLVLGVGQLEQLKSALDFDGVDGTDLKEMGDKIQRYAKQIGPMLKIMEKKLLEKLEDPECGSRLSELVQQVRVGAKDIENFKGEQFVIDVCDLGDECVGDVIKAVRAVVEGIKFVKTAIDKYLEDQGLSMDEVEASAPAMFTLACSQAREKLEEKLQAGNVVEEEKDEL